MNAPQDKANILLNAQDTLGQVRDLLTGLSMAGEGLLHFTDRDFACAIVYMANLAHKRLDKAMRKIDEARQAEATPPQ